MTPTQQLGAALEEIEAINLRLYAVHGRMADSNPLAAEAVLQTWSKASQLRDEIARLGHLAQDTPGCNDAGGEL